MSIHNCLLSSYSLFNELCSDGFFRSNDSLSIRSKCKRRLDLALDFELIFLVIEEISEFCVQMKSLNSRIFLIIGRSDESFDQRFDFLLEDPRILHIFAQNCDHIDHPKLTPIPLGFENPGWLYDDNPTNNPRLLLEEARFSLRKCKKDVILCSFNVQTNAPKRLMAIQGLGQSLTPVWYYSYPSAHSSNSQRDFYKAMASSHFVACPHGNGIDTHRLWQALLMGSTPITTYSKALERFEDYGIVFLDGWDDLATIPIEQLKRLKRAKAGVPLRELSTRYWCGIIKNKCHAVMQEAADCFSL